MTGAIEAVLSSPLTTVLAILVVITGIVIGILVLVFRCNIPVRRILLAGISFTLPVMTPVLMGAKQGSIFAVNISLADVLIPLSFLVVCLGLIYRGWKLRLPALWLAVSYVGWAIITLYTGCYKLDIEFLGSSNLLNIVKLITVFIYLYVAINLVKDRDDFLLFIGATSIAIALVCLAGSIGSMLYAFFKVETFLVAGGFRARGTLNNPNMFAGYACVGFFISLAYINLGGRKIVGLFTLLLTLSGIVLSASKGGLAGFLGSLFILFMLVPIYRKRIIGLAFVGILLLVGVYAGSEDSRLFLDRMGTILDIESKSYTNRFGLWSDSLALWQDNYFLGIGRGNFGKVEQHDEGKQDVLQRTKWSTVVEKDLEREQGVAHSTYLTLLSEMGIFGLLIYLAILLYFTVLLIGQMGYLDRSTPAYIASTAFIAAIGSNLIRGAIVNVEDSRILWILLAMIWLQAWFLSGAGDRDTLKDT